MIVLSSTAPDIAANREVEAGSRLDIPAGAAVTLLDIDGNRLEMTAPGGVVPGEPATETNFPSSLNLVQALYRIFAPVTYAKLLSTRSLPCRAEQRCVAMIAGITALMDDHCCQQAARLWQTLQAEIPKRLYIGTSRGAGRVGYRVGEELRLEAQANFDGYLYCFHQAGDGMTTRIVPLVGTAPRLNAHGVGRLPGSLAASKVPFTIAGPAGRDRIKCYASAYELALWHPDLLAGSPVLGERLLDRKIDSLFAGSGRQVATAELVIDVVE